MPFTRRDVLLAGSTSTLLAGCTRSSDSPANIVELEIVLGNGQDKTLTFQFALETADGVGRWSSREVKPGKRKSVSVAPPKKRDLVAIHGAVAGYSVSQELLPYDSASVCPKLLIEYGAADEPTILQSTDVRC